MAIPVIVNAASGTGHADGELEQLAALFRDAGAQANVMPARSGEQLQELARAAMKDAPPLVVVAGGDGSVSSVAKLTHGTETALGILPMGTLNHFARDLGIPPDLEAAVALVIKGERRRVDVGRVNGVVFLNNASIGIYPDIVRDRTRQQRRLRRSKRAAMLWAILAAMRRSPLLHLRLQLDQGEQRCGSPFVFIGNNEYLMEGFRIGERERLDTGRLSVYTTRRSTTAGLFGLAMRALFGRLHQAHDFSAATTTTLTVETKHKRLLVAIDGEVTAIDTPLEFRAIARSLWVIAPRGAAP
jgi:diacylglycerol kinase family enzyme